MAKGKSLLDHIENREVGRVVDNFDWLVYSAFDPSEVRELPHGTRYRLELRSGVEYIISNTDLATTSLVREHPAHRHARRQLVRHVYQDQLDIAHALLSGIYGGAGRKDLIELVNNLIGSMTYE